MVKKGKQKKEKKQEVEPAKDRGIEKAVMENSVALQRVLANLSVELSGLSKKLGKLLDLFESSAESLAKKETVSERSQKNEKEIVEKLNGLLDQNKILARGLTLLHEANLNPEHEPAEQQPQQRKPMMPPQPQQKPLPQRKRLEMEDYQKSISST